MSRSHTARETNLDRRDISKFLLGSAAGTALVNQRANAQSCVAPCYSRTTSEVAKGVTPVDYSYEPGDIRRYGTNASPGATPMTTAIAHALLVSASHRLIFQPETYLTGKQTIPGGANIYMPPGCKLLDTGVLGINDRFLNISSENANAPVQNVHIVGWGATVQLIKANYGRGEQRHAFHIAGAVDNIRIEGVTVLDSGGDAIYIGGPGGGLQLTPDNVFIDGVICDNSRRNAMSITAGRTVHVTNSVFANTAGTSPQKGIDVEPDASGGVMVGDLFDILISGCRSAGNRGAGFGYANPYVLGGKIVTVTFRDCVDIASNTNFAMESAKNGGENATVTWDNCIGFSAAMNGFDHVCSSTLCLVNGMRIFNPNQSGQASARYGSAYAIYSVNGTDGSTYGNLRIRDSYAFGSSAKNAVVQQILGEPKSKFANVDIEVHADQVGTKRAFYDLTSSQIAGMNRVVFLDETEISTSTNISTSSMPAYLNDVITNTGAAGALALSLDSPLSRLKGVRVKARVTVAQSMVLNPGSGWTIGGGASLSSRTVGSEITVESDGTGKWRIVAGGEGWHRDPIALANSSTPSVSAGTLFETGGTTTITALNGGVEGQEISILVKHAVTFDTTGTTLKGNGGVDISAANGDLVRGVFDGNNWRLSFHDCT